MKSWLALIRPGDWLVLLGSAVLVGFSVPVFWQGGMADRAIIRQEGKVFAEVDLKARKQFAVGGPLGTTEMLSTFTYKLAFTKYQFGAASASAVIVLIISMVLAFFYVRAQKARD